MYSPAAEPEQDAAVERLTQANFIPRPGRGGSDEFVGIQTVQGGS